MNDTWMDPEPIATSLGRLSDRDWQILRHGWARGAAWNLRKLGRKWALPETLGNFPLFETKREAWEIGSQLMSMESRHRAWKARQQQRAAA